MAGQSCQASSLDRLWPKKWQLSELRTSHGNRATLPRAAAVPLGCKIMQGSICARP